MRLKKFIAGVAVTTLLSQTVSCGYLLYPERKGQSDTGKLDAAVVALDAVGLLFFLVPGVVAFIVDFQQGTIYLPRGANSDFPDIEINTSQNLTEEEIEKIIAEHTGKTIDLQGDNVRKEVVTADQAKILLYDAAI